MHIKPHTILLLLMLMLHITCIPITFPDTDRPLLHRYRRRHSTSRIDSYVKNLIYFLFFYFTYSAGFVLLLSLSLGIFFLVPSRKRLLSFLRVFGFSYTFMVYTHDNNNNNNIIVCIILLLIIIDWRACRPERGRYRARVAFAGPLGRDVRT